MMKPERNAVIVIDDSNQKKQKVVAKKVKSSQPIDSVMFAS